MLKISIENTLPDEFYGSTLNFYLLKGKKDCGEFIEKEYEGDISRINRIPMGRWFLYVADFSGDGVTDRFTFLEDFKFNLMRTIIDFSEMYRQVERVSEKPPYPGGKIEFEFQDTRKKE